MLPIIPLLALTGVFSGAGTLLWYSRLSPLDKAKVDRIADGIAADLYDKARWQLTQAEASHVQRMARNDFFERN